MAKKKVKKITLSEWARRNGVSRQRALFWASKGNRRIRVERPCAGVILIREDEPRPEPKLPWSNKKKAECKICVARLVCVEERVTSANKQSKNVTINCTCGTKT